MPVLFDRKCSLYIGKTKSSLTAIEISEDFRVTFDIKKTMAPQVTANTGKIEVYNLAEATRNQFQEKGYVLLRAGYKDYENDIFRGQAVRVYHSKKPPDVVTTIDCLDGLSTINGVPQTFSFPVGSSAKNILDSVIKSMKIDKGFKSIDVVDKNYVRGFAFTGKGIEAIDRLCKYLKLDWSIQNDAIKITPHNKSDQQQFEQISAQTGLLESPVRVSDADPNDPTSLNKILGWQIKCLLRPTINPHSTISIDSPNSGINKHTPFLVTVVQHQGDTRGNDWSSKIDCKEQK
jgi:hypothetical protein